jgi:hypothetical protein
MRLGTLEINTHKLRHLKDLLEEEINIYPKENYQMFLAEGIIYLGMLYQHLGMVINANKIWKSACKICNQPYAEDKLATFNPYAQDSSLQKVYKKT